MVADNVVPQNQIQVWNEILHGSQGMNAATLPAYRKPGLFRILAENTYKDLANEGIVKITIGFPSEGTFPTVVRYLDGTIMDPLPVLIKVLHSSFINNTSGLDASRILLRTSEDSALSATWCNSSRVLSSLSSSLICSVPLITYTLSTLKLLNSQASIMPLIAL
jgi:hypothetical protein